VLPWQRMAMEFKNRDDWIIHGFPESFGPDVPLEMSKRPIFPFNHVAVTLKDSGPPVRTFRDLDNRNVILVENFQYPKLDDYLQAAAGSTVDSHVGVVRAFTPAGSLRMLKHKRGDVVIDWEARIIYNLASAGLKFGDVEIYDATQIVPTRNIHLAFSSRQSDKFRNFVNTRIDELTQSGKLYELVDRYYKPASPPLDFFSTGEN
jgi:ABC-type amino acid transport substrate-binding protein